MKSDQPIEGLREVFRRHGCDKWEHGYHAVYDKLPEPGRMLEVGVYKGASLRAWCEWWPRVEVVGMDTFQRGDPPQMFIQAALVKFDSRSNGETFRSWFGTFHLIIDDGSHKPRDQAATFRNLWPLLAPGGMYFIEDVWPLDLMCGNSQRHPWLIKHAKDFTMAAFLELANAITETGGKMIRHDFRAKSGKPDSVLVEIRKP